MNFKKDFFIMWVFMFLTAISLVYTIIFFIKGYGEPTYFILYTIFVLLTLICGKIAKHIWTVNNK